MKFFNKSAWMVLLVTFAIGLILDTEALPSETLERYELESSTVGRTGSHRPLVVEYSWK